MAQYLLTHEWLLGLIMSVVVAALLGLIVGYSLLTERLAARRQSKSEAPEEKTLRFSPARARSPVITRPIPFQPTLMDRLASLFVMSHKEAAPADSTSVADQLPAAAINGGQGVAKPGNAVNDLLPGNALPEEVREIVRFWAKIEAVEAAVKTGKIGQTEAIEAVFACKRSGRPDSIYARARQAIQGRTEPRYLHPLTPEQQELRKELALE